MLFLEKVASFPFEKLCSFLFREGCILAFGEVFEAVEWLLGLLDGDCFVEGEIFVQGEGRKFSLWGWRVAGSFFASFDAVVGPCDCC